MFPAFVWKKESLTCTSFLLMPLSYLVVVLLTSGVSPLIWHQNGCDCRSSEVFLCSKEIQPAMQQDQEAGVAELGWLGVTDGFRISLFGIQSI